jgi:proteasome assembly chaperone (PAC2) family protein
MTSLGKEGPFKFTSYPEFQNASLIVGWQRVGWSEDAGKLGVRVIDFLNEKLGGQSFCELKPVNFFPFAGVAIEGNVAQFPESIFYFCHRKDLIFFKSDQPRYEDYRFLNLVLDLAKNYCNIKELYTVAGIVSSASHTQLRRITTAVNQPELKEELRSYHLDTEMDFETPPHGSPTLSSYLLWEARKRGIPGVNLWGEVPFYLAEGDSAIVKSVLWFFDQKFKLDLDLTEPDIKAKNQDEKIAELRRQNPEVNKYMMLVEQGIRLSGEEDEKLIKEVSNFLSRKEC